MRFWTGLEWRPLSENEAAYRRAAGFDVIDDNAIESPAPTKSEPKVEPKKLKTEAPGQQVAAGVVPNASTVAPGKTK